MYTPSKIFHPLDPVWAHLYYGVPGAKEALPCLTEGPFQSIVACPPPYAVRAYDVNPVSVPSVGKVTMGQERGADRHVRVLVAFIKDLMRHLSPDGSMWFSIFDATQSGLLGFEPYEEDKKHGRADRAWHHIPARLESALVDENIWHRRIQVAKFDTTPSSTERQLGFATSSLFWIHKGDAFYDKIAARKPSVSKRGAENAIRGFTQPPERGRYGNQNIPWKRRDIREGRDVDLIYHSLYDMRDSINDALVPGPGDGTCHRGNVAICDTDGLPLMFLVSNKGYPHITEPWPKRLIDSIVKMSTSECGACPTCGRQWVRKREDREIILDEWVPTCSCKERGPVPATVLDPCAGHATAGNSAWRHRRNFVGIEPQESLLPNAVNIIRTGKNPNSDMLDDEPDVFDIFSPTG